MQITKRMETLENSKIKWTLFKGQLISKRLFGFFNSPKKRTKKIRLYYYATSSRIILVHLLGELKTPKIHFEIN